MSVTLIDSYGFFFKAHHALQRAPLSNSRGEVTSVIFAFLTFLYELLRKEKPQQLICVLDARGKNFRHERFPEYKANRSPTPAELILQIQVIEKLLPLMGIPMIKKSGYEADDLIAHYTQSACQAGRSVTIFSADKDLLQLVGPTVRVMKTGTKNQQWITMEEADVSAKYQLPAAYLVDYFSLVGDSSDNIPGVRGIGPVMAAKLISNYHTLENLYEALPEQPATVRAKLSAGQTAAFLSRELIDLRQTHIAELPALAKLNTQPVQVAALSKELDYYECKKLLVKFGLTDPQQLTNKQTLLEIITTPRLFTSTNGWEAAGLTDKPFPFSDHFTRQDVTTQAQLTEFINAAQQAGELIFDLETTSLDPLTAIVISVAAVCKQTSYFLLLDHRAASSAAIPPALPTGTLTLSSLQPLLEDPAIKKIGHNLKYEYEILKAQGITLKGLHHDTLLYEYLKDSDRNRFKLEEVFKHYTGAVKSDYQTLTAAKGHKSVLDVPLDELRTYALEDAEATALLYKKYQKPLSAKEAEIFHELELPLIPILGNMELSGVLIDTGLFQTLEQVVAKELHRHQQTITELAGEIFNINSTQQLQHILFTKLAIRTLKKTKTGFSTDNEVLEELKNDHPIISSLLAYRKTTKLLGTYIKTLPTMVHALSGRIHSNYHQAVAGTGRLSSQHPNLQNIPIGKASLGIRKGFIAPQGFSMVSLDYSQVELRVLAYLSKDSSLLNAYAAKADIHAHTASLIFQKPAAQLAPEERTMGKTINFSIIYGASAFSLAKRFNIKLHEARVFMELYFENYSGVTAYREQVLAIAREKLYVETYYGRKRHVRGLAAGDKLTQQRSERIAFNSVIQGTAADIIKFAMIAVHRAQLNGTLHAEMVMQVHDELVFYIPESRVDAECEILSELLRKIEPFDNILEVGLKKGASWEAT